LEPLSKCKLTQGALIAQKNSPPFPRKIAFKRRRVFTAQMSGWKVHRFAPGVGMWNPPETVLFAAQPVLNGYSLEIALDKLRGTPFQP
jgi:hypothetical protein